MKVARIYLLATAMVVAGFGAPFGLAQIPEAPGTFTDSNGSRILQPPRESPRSKTEETEKKRTQATDTPTPRPSPADVGGPR
jgi:hypothetical protein